MSHPLRLFVVSAPGLETTTAAELDELGLGGSVVAGGVELEGDARAVVRANLWLRTASRVLLRLAEFPAPNPAVLEKRAAQLDWRAFLPHAAVAVKATCRKSRIYHSGAASERVARAIQRCFGASSVVSEAAALTVMVHLEHDHCTLSLDTSGAHLHERGYRQETSKAPLRESLGAGALLLAGWRPEEPLFDPMCGSGTLPIEALLIGTQRAPGLGRPFAGERSPALPAALWEAERRVAEAGMVDEGPRVFAADRDAGAVGVAGRNATRAGVAALLCLTRAPIAAARPPAERGLMICNPPYGRRLGRGPDLRDLYAALGNTFQRHFPGWRLGLITTDRTLAGHTGLSFPWVSPVLPHGGLKIRLFLTEPGTP